MVLNVLDYPDPAAAFADATDGDTVYFPGVRTYHAPPGGWEITKSLVIRGDGPGKNGTYSGTVLTPSAQAPPPGGGNDVLVIKPDALAPMPNVTIRDLRITRRQGVTGYDGRHGIRLAEGANRKIGPTHIERVAISHLGGVGLHLVGTSAGDGALVGTWILDCDVSSCALQGMLLEHAFQTYAVRSRFAANGLEGVLGHHSEVVLRACTFDGNRTTGDASEPKADLVIDQCSLARVDACKFKNFGGGSKRACYMDHLTGVAIVGASVFELDEEVAGSIGIEFASASAPRYGAIAVLPNRFANVETAALVADAVAGATVFPQASDSTSSIVVPSGTNDAPVAVAALSTVAANLPSGLLIPVLSTIPSDQDTSLNVQGGMLVYVVMTNPASESLAAYIAGGWHDVPAS